MISLIQQTQPHIAILCRKYDVDRLYLFGSAATGTFDPAHSDLDFVVSFRHRTPSGEYASRYLGLAEDLERLLKRSVDLITTEAIHNLYFRQELEASRQLIYAA
jgi:predicted nucleotidyltransferase